MSSAQKCQLISKNHFSVVMSPANMTSIYDYDYESYGPLADASGNNWSDVGYADDDGGGFDVNKFVYILRVVLEGE